MLQFIVNGENMALLSKEQILSNNKLKYEDVEAWGGVVRVSVMSGKAKDMFEQTVNNNGIVDIRNIRAKLAAATIVDEQGNLLFSEKDIEALGLLSCDDLDKIAAVAQRLNILTDKDVEKLAKNS